jgi:hypothetical protein
MARRQLYRIELDCHLPVFCSTSAHRIIRPAHSVGGRYFVSRHAVVAFRATGVASAAACFAATIELYSRLWRELERSFDRFARRSEFTVEADESDSPLVVIRLEILILLDACESHELQSMLGTERRLALRTMLESLLRTLAALQAERDPCYVLARAQNQLLDAVLAQYSVARLEFGSAGARALARQSAP